jgi:hypothetical protein
VNTLATLEPSGLIFTKLYQKIVLLSDPLCPCVFVAIPCVYEP